MNTEISLFVYRSQNPGNGWRWMTTTHEKSPGYGSRDGAIGAGLRRLEREGYHVVRIHLCRVRELAEGVTP